ncbi:alpha/beta hydrolase [Streptomyces sp. NPDC093085]|uniref:alpha/beta hydrolase n=1 Tax=Streptomyces sp. NPDC093085 TaxID=3155068 RepID=UPI00344AF374
MRRRRLAPLLAVSVTATLAPVLATSTATAAPAAAPSAAASSAAGKGALDRYTRQKPEWKRCGDGTPAEFECATVKVPLDYQDPGGARIDVAISRIRATSPDRLGVLFSNPGGPGGPGLFMPLALAEELPEELRGKYDLIGFDPRGVGESTPVSCGLEEKEWNWLRPYKEETFDTDVAWARSVAEKCKEKAGDTLPHITTRNTARDMDVIRAILGEKKLSYLGYSYGTYLGTVYTQLFPGRSDRMVLDSAIDPERAWRGMIQWWAEGAEPAYHRWTEWVAERSDTYGLGDTPKKVDRAFWDLVEQADETPIEIDGERVTGDDIRGGMRPSFFSPEHATEVFLRVRDAAAGTSGASGTSGTSGTPGTAASTGTLGLFARAQGPGTAAEEVDDNGMASFWAVVCGDNSAAWSRDPESYRADAIADRGRYPLFGDFASSIKPCAFWDESAEPVTTVKNKVGSLIVQNEWDSQTPLPSGQALHTALKGSKMVTVLGGEGHGVYPSGNTCTDAAVTGYLLTGKLPKKDVTCQATPASNEEARRQQRGKDIVPGSPLPERAPDRF